VFSALAEPKERAPVSDESYLTTADALTYLHTTSRTLYRRLANGDIPAVRMGHQWRFRKSDLDRWVEQQAGARPAAHEPPSAALAPPPSKPRVLVADDESAVRDTLTSILELSDCDVETVADGHAAVARLRGASYDLVITDLRMPGLDGIQVASEAKRLWPNIKVIIITGYPSQSSAIDAVNIGVDGYVTKPFKPIDVLIAMARALDLGGAVGQSRSVV
jgi:excisionase family DNA binding protein